MFFFVFWKGLGAPSGVRNFAVLSTWYHHKVSTLIQEGPKLRNLIVCKYLFRFIYPHDIHMIYIHVILWSIHGPSRGSARSVDPIQNPPKGLFGTCFLLGAPVRWEVESTHQSSIFAQDVSGPFYWLSSLYALDATSLCLWLPLIFQNQTSKIWE